MSETRVVHVRKEPYDIYIGRDMTGYKGEGWGNPFTVGGAGRDKAIAMYKEWIQQVPEMMDRLPELVGKTLGCWCVPLRCHGHVLVELIEEMQNGA